MLDLPEEFAERLARIVKLVRTERTLPTQLETVVAVAKRMVPTCDGAGITLFVVGETITAAATDTVVLEVDLVQYETGEGPCLDALAESHVVRVDLVERELGYQRFAPGALDSDVNSVVSFPLVAAGRTVGALNLYSRQAHAFDDETERAVVPLVGYAAEVLSTSPLYAASLDAVAGLMETLAERALIDRATGVLMARNSWTSTEAFDALRDRAFVHGESLRDVARTILDPTAPP